MAANNPSIAPLLSLLPSFTPTTLPPRLTALATSLLAQSRQRASNLKPEEEIARPYACAEIAVDRLRESLRLPPKKTGGGGGGRRGAGAGGGPPCKPAVYKKLLGFLEGVLEREVVTPRSVGKRKRDVVAIDEDEEEEADQEEDFAAETLSKRARLSTATDTPTRTRTPASRTKQSLSASKPVSSFTGRIQKSKVNPALTTEAPAHVMPTIRKLTKHYSTPAMAPHIYTGTCVVLRLAELWPPAEDEPASEDFDTSITALVAALYLMVLTKMQRGQLKTKTFNAVCARAVEMFGGSNGKGGALQEEMISGWIRRINREGWCKGLDWWESVPERTLSVGVEGMGGEEADGPEEEDHDDVVMLDDDNEVAEIDAAGLSKHRFDMDLENDDPEGVLLPGLGTMMQESLDWNSEERKRAFESWKKGIMKRLQGTGSTTPGSASTGKKKTPASKKGANASGSGAKMIAAR